MCFAFVPFAFLLFFIFKYFDIKKNSHKAHYQFLLSHALHSYSIEGVAARTSTSFLPCTSRMALGSGSFTKARGLSQAPPRVAPTEVLPCRPTCRRAPAPERAAQQAPARAA